MEEIWSSKNTSTATGIAEGTLAWWRHKNDGTGPRWFRLGPRKIAYKKSDVLAWLDAQYSASTGGDAA